MAGASAQELAGSSNTLNIRLCYMEIWAAGIMFAALFVCRVGSSKPQSFFLLGPCRLFFEKETQLLRKYFNLFS